MLLPCQFLWVPQKKTCEPPNVVYAVRAVIMLIRIPPRDALVLDAARQEAHFLIHEVVDQGALHLTVRLQDVDRSSRPRRSWCSLPKCPARAMDAFSMTLTIHPGRDC